MLLNRGRALDLMERFSLDALIAATRENILYMSDFAPWGQAVHKYFQRPNFVVFSRHADQTPALLIYPGEATYFAAQQPWIEETYTYGPERSLRYEAANAPTAEEARFLSVFDSGKSIGTEPVEALVRLLRKKGLSSSAVGLDQEGLPHQVNGALRSALPGAKFFDASDLFRLIRMVKSEDEIARLRKACELNEAGIAALFQCAATGRTEMELAAEFYQRIGRARAVVGWQHLGSGRRSEGIFPPSDKKLEPGDLVRTDVGIYLDGYHSDTCATGVVGEATAKQSAIFAAGLKGIEACLEAVRPGARPSQLIAALNRGIKAGGMNLRKDFVGHTIGSEAREFPFEFAPPKKLSSPFLPETTDVPLEEKMVINIEIALVELGFGGIQIEHTLVVNRGGFDFITPQKRGLIVI